MQVRVNGLQHLTRTFNEFEIMMYQKTPIQKELNIEIYADIFFASPLTLMTIEC